MQHRYIKSQKPTFNIIKKKKKKKKKKIRQEIKPQGQTTKHGVPLPILTGFDLAFECFKVKRVIKINKLVVPY